MRGSAGFELREPSALPWAREDRASHLCVRGGRPPPFVCVCVCLCACVLGRSVWVAVGVRVWVCEGSRGSNSANPQHYLGRAQRYRLEGLRS